VSEAKGFVRYCEKYMDLSVYVSQEFKGKLLARKRPLEQITT